jgi:glucose-6-phosphate 1-dehydrogenase
VFVANPNKKVSHYRNIKDEHQNLHWTRMAKRLARNLTEIRVHLKPTPHALFASTSSGIDPNVITISIQPDEGISIAFDAKRPGTQLRTVTVQANFS